MSIPTNGHCRPAPAVSSFIRFPTRPWWSRRRGDYRGQHGPAAGGRRSREEVLGHGVCEIIHGGRWPHIKCPLEEFLKTRSSRVEDTRLPGLGGEYSLTVVPVQKKDVLNPAPPAYCQETDQGRGAQGRFHPHRAIGRDRRTGGRCRPRGQQPHQRHHQFRPAPAR
jgi:hypothetical protein